MSDEKVHVSDSEGADEPENESGADIEEVDYAYTE